MPTTAGAPSIAAMHAGRRNKGRDWTGLGGRGEGGGGVCYSSWPALSLTTLPVTVRGDRLSERNAGWDGKKSACILI